MKIFKKCIILAALFAGLSVPVADALTVEENGSIDTSVIFDGTSDIKFADVSEDDWFYQDVAYVYTNHIMSGVAEDEFAPNEGITRAMMITVLYRTATEPETAAVDFSDVAPSAWYAKAVSWGAANKIVSGIGDNQFSPDSPITREQMAVMLHNYGKVIGKGSNEADISYFSDYDTISPWAKEALSWAAGNHIIAGRGDAELVPAEGASRAEAAAIIKRFLTL